MAAVTSNTQAPWAKIDHPRIEKAVRELLIAIGEDPDREGLQDTPSRVAKAYEELFSGYSQSPSKLLTRTFAADGYDEVISLKDVSFWSMCEHHMLPFFGKVSLAYIPGKRVVGLSKMARLVDIYSRRLQIQERMTYQIASAFMEDLGALGAAVIVRAQHLCMCARGARQPSSRMVTSSMLGAFRQDARARQEVLAIFGELS